MGEPIMSEDTQQTLIIGVLLAAVAGLAMVMAKGCNDAREGTVRARDRAVVECSKNHPPLECKASMLEMAK